MQRLEEATSSLSTWGDQGPGRSRGLPVSFNTEVAEADLHVLIQTPSTRSLLHEDSVKRGSSRQRTSMWSHLRPLLTLHSRARLLHSRARPPEQATFLTADFPRPHDIVTQISYFHRPFSLSIFYVFFYFSAFVLSKTNFPAWPSDNHLQSLRISLSPFLRRKDLFGFIILQLDMIFFGLS